MPSTLINNFIRQLKELQEGSLWFDQSLKDKLENLTESTAFARPHPAVHCVAEHVAHMLEWRKECIERVKGGYTDLMNSAADWQAITALRAIGWTELKRLLYQSTTDMIALIEAKEDIYLDTPFLDTEYTYKYLVEGIIEHDIYHLGQIGVTLRLLQDVHGLPEMRQPLSN